MAHIGYQPLQDSCRSPKLICFRKHQPAVWVDWRICIAMVQNIVSAALGGGSRIQHECPTQKLQKAAYNKWHFTAAMTNLMPRKRAHKGTY